ncbi:Ribosome biogenesis protein [Trema orientale]|uniref:Ribosome biogenesis protein n=1 Tax=Trema orientale TaxID=63057 RepID=A0A2P5EY45_TREOI|nr:Ribosome biogenesis protein [Trema orientale]
MGGGSRAQVNKAHKTRFSSKASRHEHKTSLKVKSRIVKSEHNGKGARAARMQRNKMLRDQKRAALLKEKRASSGSTSSPRVIVLFGLSASVNLNSLAEDILSLLSSEGASVLSSTVASSDYKLRTTVLKAPHGDLLSCIEMAKVADLIAFVASASSSCEGNTSDYIDSFGSQCLSVFRSLGLPSTAVLIRDLPSEMKRKHETKKICASSLYSEFPEDCKFYPADTKDELHKFMWLFKEQRLSVPHWRSQRPYLMAQKVDVIADSGNSGKCTLLVTGYLRGRNLSVNQLVHVSGAGDYQLCKIEILKDPFPLNARKEQDIMDSDDISDEVVRCLVPDPLKQEPLLVENVPDPLAGEQTWPTEREIAEADKNQRQKRSRTRTLPRGTSEYQAAWIVDDTDEEDLASDDEADGMVLDEREGDFPQQEDNSDYDLSDDQASLNLRDSDEETDVDSVMMEGENLTREQLENEIQKLKKAHADDEEFPDEVDTPIDVPARKRFAKYRGLKSFRTSSWDPKESLPQDYARIFAFDNFTRTQKHVLSKALDMEQVERDDCIPANSYAKLHIKEVPSGVASKLCLLAKTMPVVACGLLQHESKMSVLHFSIKKHDGYSAPIKAKEELVFHVGFRQFVARPIYSTDNMNSNKHKMERFLHAGRFSIASIYAPISFPPLPLIALKYAERDVAPAVAAVGSLRSIDPDRIILKKIILTGYPQRVSKLKASVRYMFHNPEDVRWFKPVEVFTKCGRRGRIKEPVGTHGSMKCLFNGVLQQHDTKKPMLLADGNEALVQIVCLMSILLHFFFWGAERISTFCYETMNKATAVLRSSANLFRKSKARERGRGWRGASTLKDKKASKSKLSEFFGYNIRWCGAESTTISVQKRIVDALWLGERSKASSLLLSLGRGNYSLRASDFTDILNYCSMSPDPLFAMETWRVMEEKKISPDSHTSVLMIRALCNGGYIDEAFNLINFLGESEGIYPLLCVYNSFLRACAEMRSVSHANQCLDLMDHRMVGKNEATYSELLKLAVWQKNLSAVQEIWREFIKNYSLNEISLSRFIWSFNRLGDLKSACGALEQMVNLAFSGSTSLYETEGKLRSSRLDIPVPSKHELIYLTKLDSDASNEDQCSVFNIKTRVTDHVQVRMLDPYKSKPVMKVLRWAFSDVIGACAFLNNNELAEPLLAQMQILGLQPSSYTYDGFIRAAISQWGFSTGMEMLKIMQHQNLKAFDRTLATLSMACSKTLEVDLAEAMLQQISKCHRPYAFNAFFAACDKLDQPERALRVLAKMRNLKLLPDIRTYELLFSLFGTVNAPYEKGNMLSHVDVARRINAIEMDMAKNGVQHSHLSMKNLLKALGAEEMIKELIHYLHVAESLFTRSKIYLGTPIYNTVLHSLVEAKESHMATELFKHMRSCGVLPNDATYHIMIDCCSILGSFRSACALVSMMIRDGFYPKALTFTALMKILLENENFNEALYLLDRASSEGIRRDVLLFNTILKKACKKGMIDVIEFVVEQMHQEKIKPDGSTCNYVFSAYVGRGFHSTAMEALQVLSIRMLGQEYGGPPEEMELDYVLAEEVEAESKILQLFENFQENRAVALLNLRWSVMLGFTVSWSPNQSPWAERLSTNYNTRKECT